MISVSIIVPVYDVEEYVAGCFGSIAAQTWRGDLECIFVDDCGHDGSMAVVEQLVESYDGSIKMRILRHEQNRGLSAARNTGIRAAAGDYVFFMDSDDTITPDCIERLAAHVERHPGVDIVQGSINSEFGGLFKLAGKGLPEYTDDFGWIRKTLLRRHVIPVTATNKLVRRQLIVDKNLFFAEGHLYEDEIENFSLAKHVGSMAFEMTETYNYMLNSNGIMRSVPINRETMLKEMMARVSGPDAGLEILCIASFANEPFECGDAFDVLAERLRGVKTLVTLGRKCSKYPRNTVLGVWCRACCLLLRKLLVPYWNCVAASGLSAPPQLADGDNE